MVSGVVEAVERFAPDVLVDLEAFAGALVAQRLGLPWATSATNTAVLTDPFSGTPKIEAWLQKLMTDLRHRFGVPEEARDLWFSPSLVLAFTTAALLGSTAHLGGRSVSWDHRSPRDRVRATNAHRPWRRTPTGRQ